MARKRAKRAVCWAAAAALVLSAAVSAPAQPALVIVRRLPDTGERLAEARWGPAPPDSRAAADERKPQLALRLMLGGQAGVAEEGELSSGVFSDSTFSLARPVGASAALDWSAGALRRLLLDGLSEGYSTKLGVTGSGAAASADGSFTRRISRAFDPGAGEPVEHEDIEGRAAIAATLGAEGTLPLALAASHTWVSRSEEGSATADSQADKVELTARGAVAAWGVDGSAVLENTDDRLDDERTLGLGASMAVTIPVAGAWSLRPRVRPSYTRTDYGEPGFYTLSTTLDQEISVVYGLTEWVEISLAGGRADSWSESRTIDGDASEHLTAWTTGPGLRVQTPGGLRGDVAYRVGQRDSGDWQHEATLEVGGGDEESVWRSLEGRARYFAAASGGGDLLSYTGDLEASASAVPAEGLSVGAGYEGSVYELDGPRVWDHSGTLTLEHQPQRLLLYSLGIKVQGHDEPGLGTLKHTYEAGATLKPVLGGRELSLRAAQALTFARSDTDLVPGRLARTVGEAMVPAAPLLRLRYRVEWDWVDEVEAGAGSGSQLRHVPGVSVGGEGFPLSLTADYAVSHGYQGLRQDAAAALDLRLRRDLGVHADLQLAWEQGAEETLWLLAFSSVYEY